MAYFFGATLYITTDMMQLTVAQRFILTAMTADAIRLY